MREGQPAEQSAQFSIGNSPCMRGGQPRTPSPFEGDIGFSPHARGSTRSNRVDDTGGTILPACAGGNPRNGYGQFRWNDSPRMRGGHPFARVALRASLFTPQARGSTQFDMPPARRASIYPACAGINPHLGQIVLICLHLPRVCGDQPGYTFVLDYWCEFPPRARGSTLVIALSADVVYIYPACAGISLGKAQLLSRYFNLPRVRGDQP